MTRLSTKRIASSAGPKAASWSKWLSLSTLDANPAKNCKSGVYELRICKGRNPISIPRACCNDAKGILYIGCGNLSDRVWLYVRVFNGKRKSKTQFHWVYEGYCLERIGDREGLQIRWMECDNCEAEELRLLKKYKKRTGDIPPGNLRLDGAYATCASGSGDLATR